MASAESVVRSFFHAMNAQDADAATALARPDVTIAFGPNQAAGHDELRSLATQTDDQLTSEWLPLRIDQDGDDQVVHAQRIQRWRSTGEVASEDEMQVRFELDAAG